MIALFAEFTALPGCTEEVAGLLQRLSADVHAEPGNVVFDAYQVDTDRRRFFVYEVYLDEAAIETHLSAEYGKLFNERLGELIVEQGSQLTYLTPLAGTS